MNVVILVGRVSKDPELKYLPGGGKAVCTFSMAVDNPFSKDKKADFFNVVAWGKTAEATANYTAKGKQIAVKGSIHTRTYEDKTGNKRYVTEVTADQVEFLSKGGSGSQDVGHDLSAEGQEFTTLEDDEGIPF